ncbi:IclR family transcriptional regulator domain-containing protein [Microbacterium hydrocarbonoxydans]|uniref:IclR family transcriptional regulator domain-containing protein n=1 Tax=Microbacterium hydrocarbonoxydans TaxID=273678 RepID=UPI0007BB1617|nr:IclR family transcriptional regulator C-terminal domain-containing protein [Microbacterium hydrocarbonoxydans]GAT71921.1 regulatory protein, IclR [Microbacterium sp. HM58-2]
MSASSLTQGLALLDAAVSQERRQRLGHNTSRMADATGIERSRVSRLAQELRGMEFLDRDDAAILTAGPAFFRTASALSEPWLRASRAALRTLTVRLRVDALITVADDVRCLLLRHERAADGYDPSIRVGLITPIWCTGAGRALLWDHSRDELEELLGAVQFIGVGGPTAPRSPAQVHALQERDRAAGIVTAAEEYDRGIDEYALPIRRRGEIVASIAVRDRHRPSGPSKEMRPLLEELAQLLTDVAEAG